jgi:RNA polymerase sigma-70 factor, ECF subfamily
VLQEAYLDAASGLPDYLRKPTLPFFLWLRLLVGSRLSRLHRHHLGTQMRDAGREVSLYRGALPEASSAALAAQLLGRDARRGAERLPSRGEGTGAAGSIRPVRRGDSTVIAYVW